MKRSELEKYLGRDVEVNLKSYVDDNKKCYCGILTKCSSVGEKNLYYCTGPFSQEVRFRSSYVQKIEEVSK